MVEFNLLPDVKIQYLNARRLKRIVMSVSVIVGSVSLFIFILLVLFVDVAQKARINDLSNSITSSVGQIKGNTNLDKILTIQNQLQSLPNIETQTPITTRIFTYISQLTPSKATISSLNFDLGQNTATISGGADSINTVNQFVDTLKFTNYKDGTSTGNQAFSTVVLSSFSIATSSSSGSNQSQYSISFNFDPKLFESTENVSLVIPQITTTRSITSQPTDLFKANSGSSTSNQGSN